jgi:transcriptional regulator with XRE-family HTH domain
MTFQQVQKYETGANRISCSKLTEIAEALSSPIVFFFTGEREPRTEIADNLGQAPTEDGRRLVKAFGQMEKTQRKKVLALVESFVLSKR